MAVNYKLSETAVEVRTLIASSPSGLRVRDIEALMGRDRGDAEIASAMAELRHHELVKRRTRDCNNLTYYVLR